MESKAKEEAERIVKIFSPMVNPYMGSGMLSNTYDDDAIKYQSTKCALIYVEGIIEEYDISRMVNVDRLKFWQEVKQYLNKM